MIVVHILEIRVFTKNQTYKIMYIWKYLIPISEKLIPSRDTSEFTRPKLTLFININGTGPVTE